jgi:Photosynthetic reaction centre cytochrome C subunit
MRVARSRWVVVCASLLASASAGAQPPDPPNVVESPNVKVLTGLTVREFEQEMQLMTSYLGVTCGYCHEGRRNFASEAKPQKLTARTMLEMTKGINAQFFQGFTPGDEESRLGKVTCFTCHQGNAKPKTIP